MKSLAILGLKLWILCDFSKGISLLQNLRQGCLLVGTIHVLVVHAAMTGLQLSPMQ